MVEEVRNRGGRQFADARTLLAAIVDSSDDAIISETLDGIITSWNPAAERIFGYTADEAIGQPFSLTSAPGHGDDSDHILERIGRGERIEHFETTRKARDGRIVEVSLTVSPIRDPAGQIIGASKVARDITDRNQATRQLARQRELLEVTLGSIGDAVITTDAEGRVTFLNCVAERLTGWRRTEAPGRPLHEVFQIFHETTRQPVQCPVEAALRTRQVVGLANHTVLVAADRREALIDDSAAPIIDGDGRVAGAVLVFRDVTEQRRASLLNERLAAIVESSDDIIVSKDLNGIITSWNKGAERTLGYSADEVIGKHISILMPPEHREDTEKILGKIRKGEKVDHYRTRRQRKDGSIVDVSLTVSPIRNAEGEIVGASKIGRDISVERVSEELRERLAAIVESSDDIIVSKDLSGIITSWNKAAERVLGYTAKEVIGQHISILMPPDVREDTEKILGKIRKGEKVDHYETRRQKKDGTIIDVSLTVSPIRDASGKIIGASKIGRDITERKLAQQELARQRELLAVTLSSIGDAVITTDAEGKVTFLNHVAERLVGWTEAEAVGKLLDHVFEIIGEETRERMPNPAQQALETGQIVGLANHTMLVSRDGTERPIDDSAAPIRDLSGKVFGTVLIFRDISQRRKVERELREADRRKDEFLAMLAHELRNPLSSISNAMRLAREATTAEDIAWSQGVIERQLHNLSRLIDDLLDVSRITRGKIQLKTAPLDLSPILGAAAETVRPLVEERKEHMSLAFPAEPLWVRGDPTRIEQILVNLLTNAAKYTPNGGHIWFSAERQGDQAVIKVRDDGMGIAPEILPQMFELFTQGERSLARSEGGLGIGLTLVKRLTEMHGGSVSATSAGPGQGSEFTVSLPCAKPPGTIAAGRVSRVPEAQSPRRILIVDDNLDTAHSLARLLVLYGHEVQLAHSGAQAMDAARAEHPDFILMDIGLPGMDGFQVTRQLRDEPCCKNAVFIAITGYGEEETRKRARAAGFDHHLVKPIEYDVLTALLAKAHR